MYWKEEKTYKIFLEYVIKNLWTTRLVLFNASNYDNFKEELEFVAQYSFGFKPASMYERWVPLLVKEIKETENQLVEHKA